jgi:hypothetical protein
MKTNEMTPAWVVENFLPDFNNRYDAYSGKRYGISVRGTTHPDKYFINKHFPEALACLFCATIGFLGGLSAYRDHAKEEIIESTALVKKARIALQEADRRLDSLLHYTLKYRTIYVDRANNRATIEFRGQIYDYPLWTSAGSVDEYRTAFDDFKYE